MRILNINSIPGHQRRAQLKRLERRYNLLYGNSIPGHQRRAQLKRRYAALIDLIESGAIPGHQRRAQLKRDHINDVMGGPCGHSRPSAPGPIEA